MGERVQGAGQFYTQPLLMQHQKHFSKETFKISPMDAKIDMFLMFEWMSAHPPQGAWTTEEVRFNSASCLEKCTKYETNEFSLSWDESVTLDVTLGLSRNRSVPRIKR